MATVTSPAFASEQASSSNVATPYYWAWACDYGRACLWHNLGMAHQAWNVEHCAYSDVHDYYDGAHANGNSFRVFYQDGRWDQVDKWTSRPLDPNNLATGVYVYC